MSLITLFKLFFRCIAFNNMLNRTKYSPLAKVSVSKSDLKTYNLEFVNIKDFKELQTNSSSSKLIPVVGIYGKEISLGCAVKGRPKAKVVWNFKSDRDNTENKEIISMEVLKIDHLTGNNSGIYTCIANNGYQNIKQVFSIYKSIISYYYAICIYISFNMFTDLQFDSIPNSIFETVSVSI